jgi:hypothetical protein
VTSLGRFLEFAACSCAITYRSALLTTMPTTRHQAALQKNENNELGVKREPAAGDKRDAEEVQKEDTQAKPHASETSTNEERRNVVNEKADSKNTVEPPAKKQKTEDSHQSSKAYDERLNAPQTGKQIRSLYNFCPF